MLAAKAKTNIYVLIGIILVLMLTTMSYSLYTFNELKSNLGDQVHTTKVIRALNENLILLLNAETGSRGYIITGDSTYLEPYTLALTNIPTNIITLRSDSKDNPVQQKNLQLLETLIHSKLTRIARFIDLKKSSHNDTIQQEIGGSNVGKKIMDSIRVVNFNMIEEESALSKTRSVITDSNIASAETILIFEGICSLLITIVLGVTIIKELNQRSKTEKELLVSGERFFKIFDESPIAMSLSEIGTNKILFANNRFYKTFGYSKEEVIGHTSQELQLTSAEEEARLVVILLEYLKETRPVEELQKLPVDESEKLIVNLKNAMGDKGLEVLYTRKNGDNFYALLSYDLVEIDHKKFTITSYQDVSEQKQTEQRIVAYSTELERKNREIEQFAYIASHDLQEPLRNISNFSTLLTEKLEAQPDTEAREYMKYIRSGAMRMSALIFDLLEYSRVGKDQNKSPIDCNVIVAEAMAELSSSIEESGIKIQTGKLPIVNGYVYLKSLFQNLISNAIKFRKPDGESSVIISAVDRGKEYLFSIKDNGIGIEKEYFDRIFIIFQRLHTRAEYPGTGIGLSHCQKIVELHGGKMWVESELGQGSTFYFTLQKK